MALKDSAQIINEFFDALEQNESVNKSILSELKKGIQTGTSIPKITEGLEKLEIN